MPIQKVIARTTNEGLRQVAETFGDHALILKTIKRNGRYELFVETGEQAQADVDAAASMVRSRPQASEDLSHTRLSTRPLATKPQPGKEFEETLNRELRMERDDATTPPVKSQADERHIQAQYREARIKMLSAIADKVDHPDTMGDLRMSEDLPNKTRLRPRHQSAESTDSTLNTSNHIRRAVRDELTVKTLVDSFELTAPIAARLRGCKRIDEVSTNLASMIKIGGQVDHGVFAFVGPAGSGKTTSLIKLLVKHVMTYGEDSCAIINCDRFRMGAKEQLSRLGELIGVDVLQVNHDLTLDQAITNVRKRQLVLIDMPGLGFESAALTQQLTQLSLSRHNIQRILVMPANLQYAAMQRARQVFAVAGTTNTPTTCIASRLDETTSLGALISFLVQSQMPLRYIADGPQIPEDFIQADAKHIVQTALGFVDQNWLAPEEIESEFAKALTSDFTNRERSKTSTQQGKSVRSRKARIQDELQHNKVAGV